MSIQDSFPASSQPPCWLQVGLHRLIILFGLGQKQRHLKGREEDGRQVLQED